MSNSTSTTPTTSPLLETGLQALGTARWFTMQLIENIPEDKFFTAPCAGGNHAGWCAGHIAMTDEHFRTQLGGGDPVFAQEWGKRFNEKCIDDASKYPSKAELIEALDKTREAIIAWVSSLSDEQLLEPIEGDLAKFATSRAHMLGSIAFHEGVHAGQMSTARRAQGFEPLF